MSRRGALIRLPDEDRARMLRVVDTIARHGVGCPHLDTSDGIGIVCLMHPGLVRCGTCSARHIARHTNVEEHNCDLCLGPLDDAEFLALAQPFEVDTTISTGRGRRAAIGVVCVIGYGLCKSCWPSAVQR